MAALEIPALRPFDKSGYEVFAEDLHRTGEVVIWSVAPLIPAVGDLFTVERDGQIHDVAVQELATFRGGGWSARCARQA